MIQFESHWVFGSGKKDFLGFVAPLLAAFAVIVLAGDPTQLAYVPAWAWFLCMGLVDAPHVYSTLFRTYLDRDAFQARRRLYIVTPVLCFGASFLVHMHDDLWFWRGLAYFAIFHFVRQQWGWMAYATRGRGTRVGRLESTLDQALIYAATLGPVLWWHSHPRPFGWYVEGDLFQKLPEGVGIAAMALLCAVSALWIAHEAYLHWALKRPINGAKWVVAVATLAAWVGGIVWLGNALATLALIALSHGIPYMMLVRQRCRSVAQVSRVAHGPAAVFFLALFAIAATEEWFWTLLGVEHNWVSDIGIAGLDAFKDPGSPWVSVVVAVLTLPDLTHFIYDGFLWKRGSR